MAAVAELGSLDRTTRYENHETHRDNQTVPRSTHLRRIRVVGGSLDRRAHCVREAVALVRLLAASAAADVRSHSSFQHYWSLPSRHLWFFHLHRMGLVQDTGDTSMKAVRLTKRSRQQPPPLLVSAV